LLQLLFEFFTLKNLNQEKISENINLMFQKLAKLFGIKENHEKSKALIITNLYDQLTKRNKQYEGAQYFARAPCAIVFLASA